MVMNELLEPFERLLDDVSNAAQIRAIEAGGAADALWQSIEDSGFLDALRGEGTGGFGLSLADVCPLLMSVGRHAGPAPVGETMLARAILASVDVDCPAGPIAFATLAKGGAVAVPFGRIAHHFLVEIDGETRLCGREQLNIEDTGTHLSLGARVSARHPLLGGTLSVPPATVRNTAALVRAAAIAGAAERLLEMTVSYANEREQFGKPIGRQQVIQQQLAVMAEHVVASRLATQSACAAGFPVNASMVAVAKQVCGQAASDLANSAHAIHGAIGVSEEYDLQMLTRRMHEWRLADGSARWWAMSLGQTRLADRSTSIDFVRTVLTA